MGRRFLLNLAQGSLIGLFLALFSGVSFAQPQDLPGIQGLPGALMERNTLPLNPLLDTNHTQDALKPSTIEHTEELESARPYSGYEEASGEVAQGGPPIKIRIKRIQLEGATRLTADEIASVTAPFEERDSTLGELEQGVVQPLNKLYEDKGFVTTQVYIPPQQLTGGVLVIRADSGDVGEIVYEGGQHFKARSIVPRLNLKPGEPFNLKKLDVSLRRINENPDLHIQARLLPGDNPGETRVVLRSLQENFPFHIQPFMDNMGRSILGNQRLGVTLTHNNVTGFGDTLYSSFSFSESTWGNVTGYELPVGPYGTKLGFNIANNRFDFEQFGFNFAGRGRFFTPYLSQELYRSDKSVLTAELGLGIKNSSLQIEGFALNEDRIRVLTPAIQWMRQDNTGRTLLRGEVGIGLNIFNATLADSPSTSRPGAGSQFVRFTGHVVRSQKLPGKTYGIFKALAQATPSELVSLEQFQIGGASSVRGYKQGRLIGDSGVLLSAQWHVPLSFLPEELKLLKWQLPLKNRIELVGFSDLGGVFDNNPYSGVNIQSNRVVSRALIAGAGVGLRANLTRMLAARLDLGFPLVKLAGDSRYRPQLHFGLDTRLF